MSQQEHELEASLPPKKRHRFRQVMGPGGFNQPPIAPLAPELMDTVPNSTRAKLVESTAEPATAREEGRDAPRAARVRRATHETVGDLILAAAKKVKAPSWLRKYQKGIDDLRPLLIELDEEGLKKLADDVELMIQTMNDPIEEAACYDMAARLQRWLADAEVKGGGKLHQGGWTEALLGEVQATMATLTNDLMTRSGQQGDFMYNVTLAEHGFVLILRTVAEQRVVEHLESYAGREKGLLLHQHARGRKVLTVPDAIGILTDLVSGKEADREKAAGEMGWAADAIGLVRSDRYDYAVPTVDSPGRFMLKWECNALKQDLPEAIQERTKANRQAVEEVRRHVDPAPQVTAPGEPLAPVTQGAWSLPRHNLRERAPGSDKKD